WRLLLLLPPSKQPVWPSARIRVTVSSARRPARPGERSILFICCLIVLVISESGTPDTTCIHNNHRCLKLNPYLVSTRIWFTQANLNSSAERLLQRESFGA